MNNISKKFEDKIVMVSGASRGLGYEIALLLAQQGAHVLGLARTVGGLEDLADEISNQNGTSTMIPLDLQIDSDLEKLGKVVWSKWGKLDLLVHAAGSAAPMSPVTVLDMKEFDRSIKINARATQKLIQVCHPLLLQSNDSQAIFIDDQIANKFQTSYSASKAANRIIINNYKSENIRLRPKVTIFLPKPMPTAVRARFFPGEDHTLLSSCLSEAKRLIKMI